MKRKLAGLLAAVLLCTCATAADKSFQDLPSGHWAYQEIMRAVSNGIMNGLGDGRMNPDGTLTWAHYLAMISRTFAPLSYEGKRAAGTDWRTAGYEVATERGYLLPNDFLPVTLATIDAPISRQDVAVLLYRILPAASGTYSGGGTGSGSNSGGGTVVGSGDGFQIIIGDDGTLQIITNDTSNPASRALMSTRDFRQAKGTTTADSDYDNEIYQPSSGGSSTSSATRKPSTASDEIYQPSSGGGSTSSGTRKPSTASDEIYTPSGNGSATSKPVTPAPSDEVYTPAPSGGGSSSQPYTPPSTYTPPTPVVSDPPLSDFQQLDSGYRDAVRRLYELEIVKGKSDGTFGGADTVRRCDGAVLLMRTLDAVDRLRAGESVSLTLDLVDGDSKPVADTITATGRIGQSLSELAKINAPTGYKVAPQDGAISVIKSRYALIFAPLTQAEQEEIVATELLQRGQISYEDYAALDFWLKKLGDNDRKKKLIFGNEYTETVTVMEAPELPEGVELPPDAEPAELVPVTKTVTLTEIRYDTEEEAQSHMVSVEVPVWKLRGQDKVPGTLNLTVNSALAEEVKAIFTEIYDDPEQFPISDGGGYSWRTNSTSEHIQGTAIDLNVDANFQVRDGGAIVGTHWTPGDDPYSITPGGSVVRAFAEHGWDWGGNAWAGHSDPTYGYHDYMHFSYFGR
ncbi:MAG: S-layer homology domain-containing protein [Oscillibacter sp.]|nr:S-layer homology domain-containing protein [Oscillibacter sp.]